MFSQRPCHASSHPKHPRGKHGTGCQPRSAVCLEPGIYPDAIHPPAWPSPVFSPERPYLWRMRLEFSLV